MHSSELAPRRLVRGVNHLLMMSAWVSVLLAPHLARAQSGNVDSGLLEEVVVTGSRIVNPDYISPTPVTSFTEQQIALAPPKLFDALAALPQFRNSATNVAAAATISGQFLNLRNFGSQRTLVLLNGKRLPMSWERGGIDVSLIPEQLVSRVDVITGGASAAYGSDAVAGAVNFVLNTRHEGIKAELAGGTSTYGDGTQEKLTVTYGTPFAGDRGHLVVSAFGLHQDGITPRNTNRDWFTAGAVNIANPAGVRPSVVTYSSGGRYIATPNGVIPSGPLAGTTFGPGGVPQPYAFGSYRDATYQIGGDGARINPPNIIGSQKRYNIYAHAEYDLSDDATLFAEYAIGDQRSHGAIQPLYAITSNAVTIFNDNAYLTQAMRDRMQAANVTSFPLQSIWTDSPAEISRTVSQIDRVHGGIRGNFTSDWTYSGSVQFSRSINHNVYPNTMQWRNLFAAVDAVVDPATGNVVCRSTLQGITPGCVPINLMGPGSRTQAAMDYVLFGQDRKASMDEVSAGFVSQRPMFKLWSEGSAIMAGGIEFRYQDINDITNTTFLNQPDYTGIRGVPAGRIGNAGFDIGGFLPYSGRTSATEVFAELDMPIVENLRGAHKLSANMAARYTYYSPSGSAPTYKLGLVYEPIQGVRLRSSYSRDMRAPAVYEMYLPKTPSTIFTVILPFGVIPYTGFRTGNSELEPERAYNYTVGLVYEPTWLPGFGVSVDYFNIKLEGGIAQIGSAQEIADACYRSNSAFACSLITLTPDNTFATILFPIVNNTTQRTRGVDYQVSYRAGLAGGQIALRALASYTPTFTSAVAGAPVVNRAGQVINSKWLGNASASFSKGPAVVSLTGRYISASAKDITFVEGVQINENDVPAATYVDAAFLYDFAIGQSERSKVQGFLQISNLLNKDPPVFIGGGGAQVLPTNLTIYDGLGRYFTAGMRLQW